MLTQEQFNEVGGISNAAWDVLTDALPGLLWEAYKSGFLSSAEGLNGEYFGGDDITDEGVRECLDPGFQHFLKSVLK